jgi:hypothetical protein
MLGNPKNVPEGLSPMFYIGLDRDFEIDIRAKINKEIEDIQSLERKLEEAREEKKKIMRWMKKYLNLPDGHKCIGHSDLYEMYHKLKEQEK